MQLLVIIGLIVAGILTENAAFYLLAGAVTLVTVVIPIIIAAIGFWWVSRQ